MSAPCPQITPLNVQKYLYQSTGNVLCKPRSNAKLRIGQMRCRMIRTAKEKKQVVAAPNCTDDFPMRLCHSKWFEQNTAIVLHTDC